MHVSQPSLSRTITALEREIGAPLFVRTTRQVALTDVGRAFLLTAPEVLDARLRSLDGARRAAAGETGRLTIGYMDFAINGPLPAMLHRFRAAAPGIAVDLSYIPTIKQREAVLNGAIDIGFMIGPLVADGVATAQVDIAALVALLPRGHRLSRHRTVSVATLAEEPWVLGAPEPWQAFRTIVFDLCARSGYVPNIVQEATNSDGIFGLVAAGVGISMYSDSAANLRRKGVAIKPLQGNHCVETVASWQSSNTNPALARFLATMRPPA